MHCMTTDAALPPTHHVDTIVAIATAPGAGGVGIVRLSGPHALPIATQVCARPLRPRIAHRARFLDADGTAIDDGIALLFAAPASFTGEDVVELQAHGSAGVLQQLVARCLALGARGARPGEFSERAYLHGKLDLAQAEAVADLIAAGDAHAARAARRSLDGEFSRRVDAIAEALLAMRVHVEAAIDFVDEPIDTLGGAALRARLDAAIADTAALLADAEHGRRLRDGLHAVIVGPPNAGKSSLLNALAGHERAIVTDVPGTTRDLLHDIVRIDGVELTLVDTAGLRDATDAIELEGIRRALAEVARADLVIAVVDARDPDAGRDAIVRAMDGVPLRLWLHNKADLLDAASHGADARDVADDRVAAPAERRLGGDALLVSARTGAGLDALRDRLRALWRRDGADAGTGAFTARARHVDALRRTAQELAATRSALATDTLDLAAESLRAAHDALGEITGRVAPDALLGHVFSTFCIGK